MIPGSIVVRASNRLEGVVQLSGAKNSVLVIMASLLLTKGESTKGNAKDGMKGNYFEKNVFLKVTE